MDFFNKFINRKHESRVQKYEMSSELQQEIEEALYFSVNSGFYSLEETFEEAKQIIEDICLENEVEFPSDGYIVQLIEHINTNMEVTATEQNNYIRLRDVFDTLNREHIIAIDFAGYTLDDGFSEVGTVFQFMKSNNIPRRGYCFYHQQDIERTMDESIQCLYLAFHSINGDEQIALEIGERVRELLNENGFDVMWEHNLDSRIAINNFLWDKVYDGEDYGTDRAIRIMSEAKI